MKRVQTENFNYFYQKKAQKQPFAILILEKTIGQADENKELFCLKKVFSTQKTRKLASKTRHLVPLQICCCMAKACLLASKSNAFEKTRLMRELIFATIML